MQTTFSPGSRAGQLLVTVDGELDLYGSVAFAAALLAKFDGGTRQLLLDCTHLRYLDSSGVGVLIRLVQKARSVGGEFRVAGLQGSPRRVLEMSNILPLLRAAPDVDSVVREWAGR